MPNTTIRLVVPVVELKTVDVKAEGLAMFIGPLEAAVMRACWAGARGTRAIFRHVRDNYEPTNSTELAFTSVTSTVDRLYKRRMLIRAGDRNAYQYQCAYSNETVLVDLYLTLTLTALLNYYPREVGQIVVRLARSSSNGK